MKESKWYRIRQVAERTGLSAQLIRKWEERYHAVEPKRLENGYRVYDEADIQRLIRLKRLVEHDGYSIKNAVLYVQEVEQPVEGQAPSTLGDALSHVQLATLTSSPGADVAAAVMAELLQAGELCDTARMNVILNRAFSAQGMYFVIYSIIIPFLREVGNLWMSGAWSEYQEHIASNQVRDFLVNARARVPENLGGKRLLASCAPGERHDIMLQIVLLEAAVRGWKAHFLGAAPAENALEEAVLQLEPDVVVISVSTKVPLASFPDWLTRVERLAEAHSKARFFIGGPDELELDVSARAMRWIDSAEALFEQIDPSR